MNNKIEIIDRLAPAPKEIKGIKLIGCLQASLTNGAPSFACTLGEDARTWGTPFGTSKIERVFSQVINGISYDIMIVSRNGEKEDCLFIGQWNDGVWVD